MIQITIINKHNLHHSKK